MKSWKHMLVGPNNYFINGLHGKIGRSHVKSEDYVDAQLGFNFFIFYNQLGFN